MLVQDSHENAPVRHGQPPSAHTENTPSEAENNAALAVLESFMEKGGSNLTAEEQALLELLSDLIQSYEQKNHEPFPEAGPVETLKFLMEEHGLKAIDLEPVFGSRGRVSDALNGRRQISKEQAKRLAEKFHVSAAAFI